MQGKKSTNVTFSDRLSLLMETSGMTQSQIAQEIGVSATALIHYKSGRSLPGSAELYRIAKFFGCSMEWLIGGDDEAPADVRIIELWRAKALDAETRVETLKKALIATIKKF